jgi:hypothetical protein
MTISETITEVEQPMDQNNDHSEKGEIELPPIKKCFVIGNGRSIKGIDFKKLEGDTFGITMAYRHWRKIDWYPTYYVNIDDVVLTHHHKDIEAFIEEDKCKGYLLSRVILQVSPKLEHNKKVLFLEDLLRHHGNPFQYLVTWCSGSVAFLFSVILGYNEINTIGIDCNYVEFIPECEKQDDGSLIIKETPKENPNYFIDDYQIKGDRYNVPNAKTVHIPSWEHIVFILTAYTHLNKFMMNVFCYTNDKVEGLSRFFSKKDIKELL